MGNDIVDDWALLRAIDRIGTPEDDGSVLNSFVSNKPGFQIIRDDEHLRSLLRALLELNIAVRKKRREAPRRSSLALLFRKNTLKEYQAALDDLVSRRDDAFKKYEMLRRLTDYENTFLFRPKA